MYPSSQRQLSDNSVPLRLLLDRNHFPRSHHHVLAMVRKIAVVGAGASGKFPTSCLRYRHNADAAKGAAAAAALDAEDFFEEIKVFDRRETAGGTWIYDATPGQLPLTPGALPPQTDPPLSIPDRLPQTTPCCIQYRFEQTPIYELLT